jgi:hypothetical protein
MLCSWRERYISEGHHLQLQSQRESQARKLEKQAASPEYFLLGLLFVKIEAVFASGMLGHL